MRKIFLSSIALLTIAVFTASGQTTIALQKGQKYTVETTVKVSSSADVMGQTMESNNDSKSTTVYEVSDATGTGASLSATLTKLLVNASAMGQEMSFDSEKSDNSGPMADLLSPTINKSRNIKIDNKGNITEQEAADAGTQSAIMGLGASAAVSKVTELYIPVLMGKELKAGDKFEDSDSNKTEKGETKESGTYTITAVENGIASVSYSGTQQINGTMEQMGMEMGVTSSNIVKSELQVDAKTGMVLAKATVVDATVSVDAGGMTIPASGKTTITTKISPVN